MEIELVPFYCRLSRDCYDKLKYQAKKEIALEFENSVVEYYDEINPPRG